MSWKRHLFAIASLLVCFTIFVLFSSFRLHITSTRYTDTCIDTLPTASSAKTIKAVSYVKHLNKFKVQYNDKSLDTISRQLLDERGIYFPGHPEISDSVLAAKQIDPNLPISDAVVDNDLWQKHLDRNLETYIQYAISKGLKRGTYKVYVRFMVNEDGNLSNFTVSPDPGYNFLGFIETIFHTGPKWKPAHQNGKAVRSIYTQPVTLSIVKASMVLE